MPNEVTAQPSDADLGVLSFDETLKRISSAAETKSQESAADIPAPSAVEAQPTVVAPVPDVPVQAAPEGSQEVVSPRLRQLLMKEAALIERENKLKEAEARVAVPPPAQSGVTLEQFKQLYKRNKIEALKAIDPTFKPGSVAKELWYHDLGDLAPKEARTEMEAVRASGSVEALREELEVTKQQLIAEMNQRQEDMAFQQYVGATRSYVQAVPADLPLVQKFTAKKPDKVVQALLGVTDKHLRATGEVLTPAQAAQRLEQSLKDLQFTDGPAVSPPNPAPQTPAAPGTPNTLRNKHTAVQPSRGTEDELDDAVLSQRALAALEAAKRART